MGIGWARVEALGAGLAVALVAAPAVAGRISISIGARAKVREGRLTAMVRVGNSGDEAAESVRAALHLRGRERRGRERATLAPGGSFVEELALPAPPGLGRWPYRVTVDYADAHHYAFQGLNVGTVSTGRPPPARLRIGGIEAGTVARSGTVRVRIANLAPSPRAVTVKVVVPEGLGAAGPPREVRLEGGEARTVSARIANRGALPGSRYPLFVVLEYDDGRFHQALVGRTAVGVIAPQAFLRRWRRGLWAGAAALVLLWGLLVLGSVLRRRAGRRVAAGHP